MPGESEPNAVMWSALGPANWRASQLAAAFAGFLVVGVAPAAFGTVVASVATTAAATVAPRVQARRVGRPVKWVASRSEAFILDNAGRDQSVEAEMALDKDGRILAVRAAAMQNLGAYMVGAALVPLLYSLKLIPNVYKIGNR